MKTRIPAGLLTSVNKLFWHEICISFSKELEKIEN